MYFIYIHVHKMYTKEINHVHFPRLLCFLLRKCLRQCWLLKYALNIQQPIDILNLDWKHSAHSKCKTILKALFWIQWLYTVHIL